MYFLILFLIKYRDIKINSFAENLIYKQFIK